MERNIEKWNKICKYYKENQSAEEFKIQKLWEKIFEQYLNYNSLDDEIISQTKVHLGSYDRLIPDIVLRRDKKDFVVVELKRASLGSNEKFRNQLFSYLKQLKASVGILITNKLEVYVYDYLQDDEKQKSVEIEFAEENPLGEQFVALFNKENLDFNKIKEFVDKNNKVREDYAKMISATSESLVKDVLAKFYRQQGYSEISIDKFVKNIHIDLSLKTEPAQTQVDRRSVESNLIVDGKLSKRDALQMCQNNNVPLTRCITFATISGRNGNYPANTNFSYLKEDWVLLLNDCYNKKLHVLKIPANTFTIKNFPARADRDEIILAIDSSFVDSHPQQKIINRLGDYKIKTIDY